MRTNRFWLNVLNVHTSEWWIVKKLFWLQFFQGAGISFFFTAEFARFLERFPVYELPWVMVFSSVLLWLTGLIYSYYEHKLNFARFNEGIIIFMAASMLLVRVGSNFFTDDWFYYFSLAWFYVLYLLNNLEFWGIASRLFDIRQSKRLFGVISSGDIPAKFIGYTLALIFVPYTGTLNLLLLGVISMLVSIPFFRSISKSEHRHFAHAHPKQRVHHSSNTIQTLMQSFVSSVMIRRIALISMLASACIILVNYGLYANVKDAYNNDVELAKFIAMFMAGLRIIALITKTIFTSRLTEAIGVRSSLFITPAILILLTLMNLFANWMSSDEKQIFYLFGATSIAIDVLRTSINSPVLLTIMQPLPTHERLRAHNIIKGIMDPFATLFCGILLLVFFKMQQEVNLITICYTLIMLAVLWIIGTKWVNKEYLNMLISTISSRFFSQEEFSLNDPEMLQKIKDKITNGSDQEVLSILNMVASKQNPISEELLGYFLSHPSEAVKLETVKLIGLKQIVPLQHQLETLLQETTNQTVKLEVVNAICSLAEDQQTISPYLHNQDGAVRKAALTGMLTNKNKTIHSEAEKELERLLTSNERMDIDSGLQILYTTRNVYNHPAHASLIRGKEVPELAAVSIRAIGTAATDESLQALLSHLPKHEKPVIAALLRAGPKAVGHIENYIDKHRPGFSLSEQLVTVLGKIGNSESKLLLSKYLGQESLLLPVIIKALYRSKFKATNESRQIMEDLARAYTRYGAELLHMQLALNQKHIPAELLSNAIKIELHEIRELLLCLFGCMYDRDKINKVRNSFLSNQKESIANALELIEVTVKKDIARYFNILFEDTGIQERCNALRQLYTEKEYKNIDQIMGRILTERPIRYQDWTKACSLYISRKYGIRVDHLLFRKYIDSESQLLQETARYALA
ncbi:hypothetical protein [Flavihumibacter sp. ZG627]|uniref:hypothetical protein n=1 Tax=Flavihumibacter sp. ZG627 TaxID=1463156 RepID=UPI000ACFF60E|nr:hypothetical protein [Flavihumibacter sp. ZG627]